MIELSRLLAHYGDRFGTIPPIPVGAVCRDSREAEPGCVFFCLRGTEADGHRFAAEAYRRGARCFVSEEVLALPTDAVSVILPDTREAYAFATAAFYGEPASRMRLIGITGTKGKTTVAYDLHAILTEAGIRSGLIGTAGMKIGSLSLPPAENTTPDSRILHSTFARMRGDGIGTAVVEVSSQAVWQKRLAGLSFDCGIFTNLSYDHIGAGEHPDLAHYKACKQALIRSAEFAVLNGDDPMFREFAALCPRQFFSFSLGTAAARADYTASDAVPIRRENELGVRFLAWERGESHPLYLRAGGMHNIANALAAIAAARQYGADFGAITRALEAVTVPGRCEVFHLHGATVVIDYAHNAASLDAMLRMLRSYEPRRLLCLFGAVGERSRCRRYAMGAVAAREADFCILTSDDPGKEPPEEILSHIAAAFAETPHACPYRVIPDRAEAVERLLAFAEPGDIVLLAGKGHEQTQRIGGRQIPLCERDLILGASGR